jgi:hypothetical protein
MVVEVTLQDVHKNRRQSKSNKACWFPFKKQYDNRPKPSWQQEELDYDGVNWGKGGSPSRSMKSIPSKYQGKHHKRGGSVSTGTDASSYGGYSNDSSPTRGGYDTSVASHSHLDRNLSHLSYQTADSSRIQRAFLSSNNSVVRSVASLDEEDSVLEMGPDGLPLGQQDQREQNLKEQLFPMQLAMAETNCMTKTFWVDEVVEGGAFACLQQKESKPTEQSAVKVQIEHKASLGEKDFKIVKEVHERPPPNKLDRRIQQKLLEVSHGENMNAKGLRYVSQEPENIQPGSGMQRAMCSRVRLGKKNKNNGQQQQQKTKNSSSLSQISSLSSSQPSSQNQTDSSGSSSVETSFLRGDSTLKRGSRGGADALPSLASSNAQSLDSSHTGLHQQHHTPHPMECFQQRCGNRQLTIPKRCMTPEDEKNAPNFYVEVEAMQEQLNGIRDLEVIEAEDKRLEQDIGLARTSSLVDGDSTFMDSVFEDAGQPEQPAAYKPRALETKTNNRGKFGFWKRSSTQNASQKPLLAARETNKQISAPQSFATKRNGSRLDSQNTQHRSERNKPVHSMQDHPKRQGMNGRANGNIRGNSGPVDIDEVSISQKVVERLKKMEKEPPVARSIESTPAAAKYYQRREMLGLREEEPSSDRLMHRNDSPASSPTTSSSSSSPSSRDRGEGSRTPSFDSSEVKPQTRTPAEDERKNSLPQRPFTTMLSPSRRDNLLEHRRQMGMNAAHDAYFGLPKSRENELEPSKSAYPEYNVYSNHRDQNQLPSQLPNFEDDFWKDDDDADEIKSAAFEEFDGDDSLFGDLKSNAESKESQPSQMSFGKQEDFFKFGDPQEHKGETEQNGSESNNFADFDLFSRADRSRYTYADQTEYTRYTEDYTEDPSKHTAEDSRYNNDMSLYTTDQYTTDYSRYSRGGDTSFVSRTSRGTRATNDVSAYLQDGDGELVAAIDKWLY